MRTLSLAMLTAVVVAAVPATANAQAEATFGTPGDAVECNWYGSGLICWTPNDGFTVSMSSYGRVSKSYRRDHRGYITDPPLLRFGSSCVTDVAGSAVPAVEPA
jgi:hypothetical protein